MLFTDFTEQAEEPATDREIAHAIVTLLGWGVDAEICVTPKQAFLVAAMFKKFYSQEPFGALGDYVQLLRVIDKNFPLHNGARQYQLKIGHMGEFMLRVAESPYSEYNRMEFYDAMRQLEDQKLVYLHVEYTRGSNEPYWTTGIAWFEK